MKNLNSLFISLVIGAVLVMNLAGCASLRQKFIRKKKKDKDVRKSFSHLTEYKVRPHIELYTRHYIYWRSWHREIIELLGKNSKKDKRCIREMIGNLDDMRSMLVDEKGDGLDKHIKELESIEKDIKRGSLTEATMTRIRRTLEKEFMLIKIEYSYTKMEPYMRSEFRRD